ncbi:unnamed protein product [Brassicogethes aeneus]|uniref:Uncharacterized protein n=1 Tax=Brassicogethes aeneus TaxID=1431903 RepID=A0A9P0B698_BRAAE|nr:unnamed protein product [Brassicogethes aeneus]
MDSWLIKKQILPSSEDNSSVSRPSTSGPQNSQSELESSDFEISNEDDNNEPEKKRKKVLKKTIVRNKTTYKFSNETTDISTKKQCALTVIYFDIEKNKVVTQFFDLIESEGSTAIDLFELLILTLKNKNLPLTNLVGFSSDTTNVMAGTRVLHSVFTLLKENIPHIICIKCSCHMAHLATSKACLKLPKSVEDLLRNIGSHFHRSSQRTKRFEEFQTFFEVKIHKILSPAVTRWLSIKNCVDRVLEQYEPLKGYFRELVFEDPSHTTQIMIETLENKFTKAYLEFMSYTLGLMTDFNILFQSEKPLLYKVKPETEKLLKTLCSNYMEINIIRKCTNIFQLNHLNPKYFAPLDKIYLGLEATETILYISESSTTKKDVDNFLKTILEFYLEL